MTRHGWTVYGAAILIACSSFFMSLVDLRRVPFHPDESSWIFMSHDVDTALSDFGRLRWRRGGNLTGSARLRLLDAPLAKYAIGVGRWVGGYRNVPSVDWDWTESWEQDVAEGALPAPRLLQTARISAVAMYALSVGLFFVLAVEVVGFVGAAVATVLLTIHPLEDLHLRRAMAESALQFSSLIVLLACLRLSNALEQRQVLLGATLAGLALGLAVASKHSAAALALVAFVSAVAAGWRAASMRERLRNVSLIPAVVAVSAGLAFVVLNPVTYDQPLRAAHSMFTLRQMLAGNQAKYTETVKPEMVLPSVSSRLSATARQVFWSPPAFSEFPGYDDRIADDVAHYSERPITKTMTRRWARLSFLALTIIGATAVGSRIVRDRAGTRTRALQLVLVWIIANIAFIALFVPLDWQRYFVPVVPATCLLAGYGVAILTSRLYRRTEAA